VLNTETARALEQALEPRLGPVAVVDARPVGGGCISTVLRVQLEGGRTGARGAGRAASGRLRSGAEPLPRRPVFVKLAAATPPGSALLEAEAESLGRLRAAGGVRVPEVLALREGWLALEWLEPGPASPSAWERLGAGLAVLHRQGGAAAAAYGWPRDNFIGSLPQANAAGADWAAFWRTRRLEPQIALARAGGLLGAREAAAFEPLLDRLPALLSSAEDDGPALLHGDLWSGNVHMLADGEPAVIDPAAYYGHREVDLAMAALFGGFHPSFYRAYQDAWPLRAPGLEQRRAAYQLYYLMVHLNLFGRGYLAGTRAALERALSK